MHRPRVMALFKYFRPTTSHEMPRNSTDPMLEIPVAVSKKSGNRRREYVKVPQSEKLSVGGYASENGVAPAVHYFKGRNLKESTVRLEKLVSNEAYGETSIYYDGKLQKKVVLSDGQSIGMKLVLEERGVDTRNMKADDMRVVLGNHHDFKRDKTALEYSLHEKHQKEIYLPKFHCELNLIE
uniref:Uncharacterized protein n=1 Tax=Amphimedon queenslandica TaxID=400682 RepID=A0A1X7V7N7_AMPQE